MNLKDVRQFADKHMAKWGLTDRGWILNFNNRPRRRLGCCFYRRKIIEITKWYAELNSEELVLDTILREIAHALDETKSHHGAEWKRWCRKVGAEPRRQKPAGLITKLEMRLISQCTECGLTHTREQIKRTWKYWCNCQSHRPLGERILLSFRVNKNATVHKEPIPLPKPKRKIPARAADSIADGSVKLILNDLSESTDPRVKKRLRAKLRRLGHKGGMRGVN